MGRALRPNVEHTYCVKGGVWPVAIISKMASDFTGAEAAREEFGKMVVRKHPKFDEPKELDYLPTDLEGAKPIAEVVVLELTAPDGTESDMLMTPAEFEKLFKHKKSDVALAEARGTKGRRPRVTG